MEAGFDNFSSSLLETEKRLERLTMKLNVLSTGELQCRDFSSLLEQLKTTREETSALKSEVKRMKEATEEMLPQVLNELKDICTAMDTYKEGMGSDALQCVEAHQDEGSLESDVSSA